MSIQVQPQTVTGLEELRAKCVREIATAYAAMTSEGNSAESRAQYAQVIKACIKLVKFTDKEIRRLKKAEAANAGAQK